MPTLLAINSINKTFLNLSSLLQNMIPELSIITVPAEEPLIETAKKETVDTILIELDKIPQNGLDICRELKSDPKTKHIPLVVLTSAENNPACLAEILAAGVEVVLKNPVDDIEVAAQIRTMLRLKKAENHSVKHNSYQRTDTHAISLEKKQSRLLSEIEERKLIEEALLSSTSDGVIISDKNGNITLWNNGSETIFGYKEEEVNGQPVAMLMPEQYRELHRKGLQRAVKTGKSTHIGKTIELEGLKKNGTVFPLELSLSTWKLKRKRSFSAIIRDISDRKKAGEERTTLEHQLHQAKKMETIGNMAGGIAHDFNNILFPIIGFTEMLLEDAPKKGDNYDSLTEILTASLRARDLVKQILTFSQQVDGEIQPMRMQDVVNDILQLMRSSLPSTIKIEASVDDNCNMLYADYKHLQQIIVHLITNAFHAMEKDGGTLKVELSECTLSIEELNRLDLEAGNFIRFSVSDTGHGIKKETINRIFDPYYTTKQRGKSSGLGLSVVHGLVKNFNGNITVESEPDEGSVFNVYLPVYNGVKSTADITFEVNKSDTGDEHILLVDDEKSVLKLERQILERIGYSTTCKSSSLEALETFNKNPDKFDLVITDMTMPEMTGDKLAMKLKERKETIPIILCTGFSENLSSKKVQNAGFEGFLMKPIVKSEFSKKVRMVLDSNKGVNS